MKCLLSIFFCYSGWVLAQKPFHLGLVFSEGAVKNIPYQSSFSSTLEREKEIQKILFDLYDQSFIAASIDSIVHSHASATVDSTRIFIHVGKPYKWAQLKRGNIEYSILQEAGFKEPNYFAKPLAYNKVKEVQEKIITYYENNGYPFASIKLDSIHIQEASISAVFNLQKNNFIKVDSLVNRGSGKISSTYLQNYVGIKNNSIYKEELVKTMGVRLKQIPFLTERIPCRVLFQSDKAKIELFLEKKPASRFDGIVGLLPNNQTGSLLFTGDVLLKLHNSFNRGELLEINWRRLQVATQDLKTRFVYPFLLKSPFGADLTFKLYKKDSTFLEVNPNIGVQYQLTGGNYFKVFFNRRSMVLLSTNHLKYLTILPDYADIATTLYGIGLKLERLDSPLNPRKGYLLQGATSAGNRTIKKNQKLNESIYKDVQLQSVQYMSEVEGMIYFPVRNRSTLKMANQSAWIKTPTLFTNDLYRIGGLKTLRGFDEESIAASLYSIFTFEYRFLFEENSNLSFFSDVAYYENNSLAFKGDRYDLAYSVGAGIHFQTKAGIFSMNYALGSQYNNGIDSRRGKIHFGIVNNF